MHRTNGWQEWSKSAMSRRTSASLGAGRDSRASQVRGEVEVGKSGRTQAPGRSLAMARGCLQVQSEAHAWSS